MVKLNVICASAILAAAGGGNVVLASEKLSSGSGDEETYMVMRVDDLGLVSSLGGESLESAAYDYWTLTVDGARKAPIAYAGHTSDDAGTNCDVGTASINSDGQSATTSVTCGDILYESTFEKADSTDYAFVQTITITNIGGTELTDLHYRRAMDFDASAGLFADYGNVLSHFKSDFITIGFDL